MARYTPGNVPTDPAAWPEYFRNEHDKIAQAMDTANDRLTLRMLSAEPKKYGDGTVVLADGILWQPTGAAIPGYYGYYGSAWHFLG